MYCSNCGKKIDEKAYVCIGCGVLVANKPINEVKPSRGMGIASLILGIIGFIYSFFTFIGFVAIALDGEGYYLANIICSLFAYAITVTGLCLALKERKKEKNGFNAAGLTLNLLTIILATLWVPMF